MVNEPQIYDASAEEANTATATAVASHHVVIELQPQQQRRQQQPVNFSNVSFEQSVDFCLPRHPGSSSSSEKQAVVPLARRRGSVRRESFAASLSLHTDEGSVVVQDNNNNNVGKDNLELSIYHHNFLIRTLEKIPIVIKLLLLLFPPVLGIAIVSTILFVQNGQSLSEIQRTDGFLDIGTATRDMLYELQKERGMTFAYVSGQASWADRIQLQRQLVDTQIAAFRSEYAGHRADLGPYRSQLQETEYSLFALLDELRHTRDMIDSADASSLSFATYTNLASAALDNFSRLVSLAPTTRVTPKLFSFSLLMRVSEKWSHVRGYGVTAFSMPFMNITQSNFRNYVRVYSETQNLVQLYLASISPDDKSSYQQAMKNCPAMNKTMEMIRYVLSADTRNFDCSKYGQQAFLLWWESMTLLVDTHKNMLHETMNDIAALSKYRTRESADSILLAAVVVIVIAILCLILSILGARVLIAPWTRLNRLQEVAISRFVPHEFLRLLGVKRITDLRERLSCKMDLTIMFIDIRNFSGIAEQLDTNEIFSLINSFQSAIGPAIRQYNGYVDKHTGDGCMCVFTSPLDALLATSRIAHRLRNFQSLIYGYYPEIRIGIGINHGEVIIGMVGEERRVDGTLLGDVVNAAARLESATKAFGAFGLASGSVVHNSPRHRLFDHRFVGNIRVKGKRETMPVYEVLVPTSGEEQQRLKIKSCSSFNKAMQCAMGMYVPESENGDGGEEIRQYNLRDAVRILQDDVLAKNPDDILAVHRLKGFKQLLDEGQTVWDGTEELLQK